MSSNLSTERKYRRPPRQTRLLATMGAYTKEKDCTGLKQETSKSKQSSCHKPWQKSGKSRAYVLTDTCHNSDQSTSNGNDANQKFIVEKFDVRKELDQRQLNSRSTKSMVPAPDHFKWYMSKADRCDSVASEISNSSTVSSMSSAHLSNNKNPSYDQVTSKILDIELL